MAAICYGQKVTYNYDRLANFSTYHTYAWVNIAPPLPNQIQANQIVQQNIMHAVDDNLTQKGFVKAGDSHADLDVGFQVGMTQQQQLNTFSTGGGPGWGWGPGWGAWGGGISTTTTSTIDTGTLVSISTTRSKGCWCGADRA